MIDLCPDTIRVVSEMAVWGDETIPYLRTLARDIDMPVEQLRRIVHQLMRDGLVTYGPLFNTDTGTPSGSSYWLTEAGAALQRHLRETAVAA